MAPKQQRGTSKQDYVTPADFITATKKLLGITEFAHDFAADASNTKALTFFDEEHDALSVLHWEEYAYAPVARKDGAHCRPTRTERGFGWLNPPFANITPWAAKCARTKAAGGSIAFLTPAAVGSNWFRDFVEPHALVLALNGRLHFMVDHPTWGYPKDCILSLFGPLVTPGFRVWNWREQA